MQTKTENVAQKEFRIDRQSIGDEVENTWNEFRLVRGKIFIQGFVAGRSASGILDTGAEFSIIDANLAAFLRLPAGQKTNIQVLDDAVDAWHVSAVEFEIPGQLNHRLPMVVMDLSPIAKVLGESIDFILGGDLLRHHALSLDVSQRRFCIGLSRAVPQDYNMVPVKLIRNTPFLIIGIGGHPVTALLDFGSNSELSITPEIWAKVKPASAIVSDTVNGDGAGNLTIVGKARLDHMLIGGFRERDLDIRIKPATMHLAIARAEALIGLGIIGRYSVVLDLPMSRLWLRPATNPPERSIDRSGLALAPEPTGLRVLHVSRGSPASETGWKAGECICAVNGKPIEGADPQVTEWAKGPAGTTLELSMGDGSLRLLTLRTYY